MTMTDKEIDNRAVKLSKRYHIPKNVIRDYYIWKRERIKQEGEKHDTK